MSTKHTTTTLNRTITDIHDRTTIIHDYEAYTVLYTKEGDNRINLATNIYLNYPNDDHIGSDDCEGNGPWRDKVYFDGADDRYYEKKTVLRVFTTKEWQQVLARLAVRANF